MILVTGAAGKTGRAVVAALAACGRPVRAFVGRPEQSAPIHDLGAREVMTGDMRDPEAVRDAFRGVDSAYHICPNVSPEEVKIGALAIEAAREAGTRRFVYHSVLHPQVEAMPHHWLKLRVEERLFASGLEYTILQPAAYMQNVTAQWRAAASEGLYRVPYPAGTRLGMVDLLDVAEVAAKVLTEPGHEGATYEVAGPEAPTQDEVAETLGAALGRAMRVEVTPLAEWELRARAGGMGEYQVDTLLKMFAYYARHGFWGNSRVLELLLGRPATTFREFVRRVARESEMVKE